MTALQLARSESIRLQRPVTVRHSGLMASRNWGAGWTAFIDTDGNGLQSGATETTLRVGAPAAAPITAIGNGAAATHITFNGDGSASAGSAIVIFCNDNALQVDSQSRSRALLISRVGRVRIATDNNHDGVPEDDAGVAIASCTAP
ncbi:MAG: GspH/FimT family protein [Burkholderiaceae bacterium]